MVSLKTIPDDKSYVMLSKTFLFNQICYIFFSKHSRGVFVAFSKVVMAWSDH